MSVKESDAANGQGGPHVQTFPLNSRRLTASIVTWTAAGLELLKASLADSRQMIEGKLAKGRERGTFRWMWSGRSESSPLDFEMPVACFWRSCLVDGKTGMTAKRSQGHTRWGEMRSRGKVLSRTNRRNRARAGVGIESAHNRVLELESRLEVAILENSQLREVRTQDKLREERDKYNALWSMNCEQLTEYDYDCVIASKEEEI